MNDFCWEISMGRAKPKNKMTNVFFFDALLMENSLLIIHILYKQKG